MSNSEKEKLCFIIFITFIIIFIYHIYYIYSLTKCTLILAGDILLPYYDVLKVVICGKYKNLNKITKI